MTSTLSVLVLVIVLFIWMALAFGIARARFTRIRIGNDFEHDPQHNYWRLKIHNDGYFDVETEMVMDEELGKNPPPGAPWRSVELEWTDYPKSRPWGACLSSMVRLSADRSASSALISRMVNGAAAEPGGAGLGEIEWTACRGRDGGGLRREYLNELPAGEAPD